MNAPLVVPLVVLGAVIALIALRQVAGLRLRIWQIMVLGALGMLLTRSIDPDEAVRSLDVDVMLFLGGMFVLGRALEDSGVLAELSHRLFSHARSEASLMALVVVGSGAASAILMNDTVAIVGVPVVVALGRAHHLDVRPLLLGLAFGVTAGSVVSPIGNPQNLLVALALEGNPFVTFAVWLAVPTAIALALTYAALRLTSRSATRRVLAPLSPPTTARGGLARVTRIALVLLLLLVVTRVFLVAVGSPIEVRLTVIALVPALLVLVLSRERMSVLRGVDWPTLAFFAALFVVVEAVDSAGVTAEVVARLGDSIGETSLILGVSAALSQVVSNVPLVALYLPALQEAGAGAEAYMALAAGSTLAGNLTLIGAASNVIVAERRFGVTLGFWEFTRIGAPLALAQLLATGAWLAIIG